MATSTTSPAAVATAILEALNAHDADAMKQHYAPVIDERLPDAHLRSPEELAAYMRDLFAGVPDVRMDVQALMEDGEQVMLNWILTGTHTGVFQGIKPTGKSLSVVGFELMTIRDGKLVENIVSFDRQALGQQLGMLPPDGSAPERAMKAMFNGRTTMKGRFARHR